MCLFATRTRCSRTCSCCSSSERCRQACRRRYSTQVNSASIHTQTHTLCCNHSSAMWTLYKLQLSFSACPSLCVYVCVYSQSEPAAAAEEEEEGDGGGGGRRRRGAENEHRLPASCDITSCQQPGGRRYPAEQLNPQCLSQPGPTFTSHLVLLPLLSSDLQHPGG